MTIALAPQPVESVLRGFDPLYVGRYHELLGQLAPVRRRLRGAHVLDYGCGRGLSSFALIATGAEHVTGVEAFADHLRHSLPAVEALGLEDRITMRHVADTRRLPYESGRFDAVLCNALFEHIPQPRSAWIRETWRMVKPGGLLIVNETPNKYLPADFHTLHLPLTNWLPSRVAYGIGRLTGRFRKPYACNSWDDWQHSGWRGMGYYEFTAALEGRFTVEHEVTRPRHRVLRALGLPAGLLDPYPLYVVRKH
jgi:ubiquinone/menaquinone biosynthesis C-methylase UbiE